MNFVLMSNEPAQSLVIWALQLNHLQLFWYYWGRNGSNAISHSSTQSKRARAQVVRFLMIRMIVYCSYFAWMLKTEVTSDVIGVDNIMFLIHFPDNFFARFKVINKVMSRPLSRRGLVGVLAYQLFTTPSYISQSA